MWIIRLWAVELHKAKTDSGRNRDVIYSKTGRRWGLEDGEISSAAVQGFFLLRQLRRLLLLHEYKLYLYHSQRHTIVQPNGHMYDDHHVRH
jgi:hypothetical protein